MLFKVKQGAQKGYPYNKLLIMFYAKMEDKHHFDEYPKGHLSGGIFNTIKIRPKLQLILKVLLLIFKRHTLHRGRGRPWRQFNRKETSVVFTIDILSVKETVQIKPYI